MAKQAVKKFNRGNVGYLYILPWIIGFLIFQFYPFLMSFAYAFSDYSIGGNMKFIGLDNFKKIFTVDAQFKAALTVTFKYVFMAVPMKLTAALAIAMLLNMKVKGMNIFRTIYYLPSILGGSVAVSIVWRRLFVKEGVINAILGTFGIAPIAWLTDPKFALATISLLSVWQFGSSMLFFLSGLQQVPAELYEAAEIDGAGKVRSFFKITIPLITPMIFFNLVMQLINAFQDFTPAFIITEGGPLKSTYLYGLLLYQQGFLYFKMGYASALSWVLFVIILIFTLLVFKSSSYWTFYADERD